MKLITFAIVFVLVSSMAMAYPIIISESPINHTQAKELVYSIPEEYYKYVNVVEFVNEPMRCKVIDEYGQKKCYFGWYNIRWGANHNCYNGKITIHYNSFPYDTLRHELGHIYSICELKNVYNDEEFADEFKVRYS